MPSLLHALRTKGVVGTTKRGFDLLARYGLGTSKMRARIESYLDVMEPFAARPTFPVTANVVSRHFDFFRVLAARCELAAHGLVHDDYRAVPPEKRSADLSSSMRILRGVGIERPGFRAPYLSVDEEVLSDVKRAGFAYDASTSVFWPVVNRTPAVDLALKAYRALIDPGSAPEMMRAGLPVLPTSLPDDEILVDRLGIRDANRLAEIWVAAFNRCLARGLPFVVEIHPERIAVCEPALRALLAHAQSAKPSVDMLQLREIAERVRRGESPRALSITGDVDVLEVLDRVRGPLR